MHPRLGPLLIAAAAVAALVTLATPSFAIQKHAFVLTTDFSSSGSTSVVDLATRAVTRDVEPVYKDARIRWFGGQIYVVNRFGQDNIQVIDPATYATVRQFSVGNGSNPQDIAFVSATKAYVTRLASSRLLIVNPATGDSVGAISLAAFADADHVPDMDHMIRVGNRVFVVLERLANFQPTDSSVVVAIDTQADTVIDARVDLPGIQPIALPGLNPTTAFDRDPTSGRLVLGCTGSYGVNDGGVAWIDPDNLTSGDFAITEAALGGDVLDVCLWTGTRAYAIVSDAGFNTSLVAWNPSTGQTIGTVFAPGGFSLSDVALDDRGELYVCDSDFLAPGLFVYSASTGARLAGPLDMGLQPFEVAFDHADVASADAGPASVDAVATLSAPWPQPARDVAHARLTLPQAASVEVQVIDLAGRQVRSIARGEMAGGTRELTWDSRDDSGHRVAPGVYLLRASLGQTTISQRLVLMN